MSMMGNIHNVVTATCFSELKIEIGDGVTFTGVNHGEP